MNTLSLAMEYFDPQLWQSLSPAVTVPLVLAGGLSVAAGIRLAAARVLEACRFNRLCERVGFTEFLRKGQVRHSPAKLTALLACRLVLLITVLWSLHLMEVELVGALLERVHAVLPVVIVALCVVGFGYVIVAFCANLFYTIARNAGFAHADLLAKATRWLGMLLVVSLAAEQLGVEFRLIGIALQIALAAAALGLALAFGLGGKDLARDAMQKYLRHLKERQRTSDTDMEG